MGNIRVRVLVATFVVVGAIAYFGFAGFQEGKAYYKTVEELTEMGGDAYGKRIRVAGIVGEGSIRREGANLTFVLEQNELSLPVRYTGTSPVPDTFEDGAEAICEGQFSSGVFEAQSIQAKCASKYEEEYGTAPPHDDKSGASRN